MIDKKSLMNDIKLVNDIKEVDPIGILFQYFTSNNKKDVEYEDKAKQMYIELGWPENSYYDVINSFWTTFSFSMHSMFPNCYDIAKEGNVRIYKNHYNNYYSFPEIYLMEGSNEKEQVEKLCRCEEYKDITNFAKICHSVANFMPCPKGFNSAKGIIKGVKDYFPLMIDKIQDCIDNNIELKYDYSNRKVIVPRETIEEWHSFFYTNMDKYCLNMYYEIDEKTKELKGIPFFDNQSLKHPCPMNKDEVEKCLKKIVKCIDDRASQISEKYNKLV